MSSRALPWSPELRRGVIRRFLQLLFTDLLEALVLFLAAGTLRWTGAWLFLGAAVLLVLANGLYVLPRNPEVVEARGRAHQGTRGFDKAVLVVYTLSLLAALAVAGLDAARFRWAPLDPRWAVPGLALMVLATLPIAGAMAHNRNLEQTVRIQTDRGHAVATTGPYRLVRHPMYAGMTLNLLALPLVLGSAWCAIPALCAIATLVVRTALEDRTLRRELPGYADYAARTRFRLVPGLW